MTKNKASTSHAPLPNHEIISAAKISWREDEQGNTVPVSDIFNDVYYSLADGLAESRYVFLEQNNLPERFALLFDTRLSISNKTNASIPQITIAELGFGSGLNILATWQLWHTIKKNRKSYLSDSNLEANHSHKLTPRLHLISTEKFPLTPKDLREALASWEQRDPNLAPFIKQLLTLYPPLVAGCHRLHLDPDVTLDLWFGDATSNLAKLHGDGTASIDAWYLDGFAPSCNDSLWVSAIFNQMRRLSTPQSTFATYSSAGIVKRGLTEAGFAIKKVKGFGIKRQMLAGTLQIQPNAPTNHSNQDVTSSAIESQRMQSSIDSQAYSQVTVIGAGVSGLMAAWSLAQRGIQVTIVDKTAPLAGASGNPRGLLSLKMTPLTHVAEHLHSIGYLYSQRFYRQLDTTDVESATGIAQHKTTDGCDSIFEPTGTLDLLLKTNVDVEKIALYPKEMAVVLSSEAAHKVSGLKQQDLHTNLYLPQSGLINPRALADKVLSHPNIRFKRTKVIEVKVIDIEVTDIEMTDINSQPNAQPFVQLSIDTFFDPSLETQDSGTNSIIHDAITNDTITTDTITTDAVIIAAAYDSHHLDQRIFDFRKIRGQLSWFEPNEQQIADLPKLPLKYNGYCAMFNPQPNDDRVNPVTPHKPTFMLGASFVRNDTATDIRQSEHKISRDKLITAIPEMQDVLSLPKEYTSNTFVEEDSFDWSNWHARASVRAQTPDYHPLVGQLDEQGLIWTLSGMGSKGYAFAPLCAEILVDKMTGQIPPLPSSLLARLDPKRKTLQTPLPA